MQIGILKIIASKILKKIIFTKRKKGENSPANKKIIV